MSLLVCDSSVVQTEFEHTVANLCNPLAYDLQSYVHYADEGLVHLDRKTIIRLVNRVEYTKHRIHDILHLFRNHADTHVKLNDAELGILIESSWRMIERVEFALERLLRYTSYRAQYFPNTLRAIESIELERGALSYYQKLSILEIAARERDAALQQEIPRLLREKQRHIHALGKYDIAIASTLAFWEDQKEPLFDPKYASFADFTHTALSMEIPHEQVTGHTAILGRMSIAKALEKRVYVHRVHKIFHQFRLEESELMSRLRIWLGMRGMYRPLNIPDSI
jgi:hypothetical protein